MGAAAMPEVGLEGLEQEETAAVTAPELGLEELQPLACVIAGAEPCASAINLPPRPSPSDVCAPDKAQEAAGVVN